LDERRSMSMMPRVGSTGHGWSHTATTPDHHELSWHGGPSEQHGYTYSKQQSMSRLGPAAAGGDASTQASGLLSPSSGLAGHLPWSRRRSSSALAPPAGALHQAGTSAKVTQEAAGTTGQHPPVITIRFVKPAPSSSTTAAKGSEGQPPEATSRSVDTGGSSTGISQGPATQQEEGKTSAAAAATAGVAASRSASLLSVAVLPLQAMYRPAFFAHLTPINDALKLPGTLEELMQRSICGLPTSGAQLVAKAQHLRFTPPDMQLSVTFQRLTLAIEAPDQPTTESNDSSASPEQPELHQQDATGSQTPPPPCIHVQLDGLQLTTPDMFTPLVSTSNAHVLQQQLLRAASNHALASSSTQMSHAPAVEGSRQTSVGINFTAEQQAAEAAALLTQVEQHVIFQHLHVNLPSLKVLYSASLPRAGDASPPMTIPLNAMVPLLPPVVVNAALAVNRLTYDCTMPHSRVHLQLGGLADISLHACHLAAFQQVLTAVLATPLPTPETAHSLRLPGEVMEESDLQDASGAGAHMVNEDMGSSNAPNAAQGPHEEMQHPAAPEQVSQQHSQQSRISSECMSEHPPPHHEAGAGNAVQSQGSIGHRHSVPRPLTVVPVVGEQTVPPFVAEVRVELLPFAITFIEDTASHAQQGGVSAGQPGKVTPQDHSHAAATLACSGARASITTQGSDINIDAAFDQAELQSLHSSQAAAQASTGGLLKPVLVMASRLLVGQLGLQYGVTQGGQFMHYSVRLSRVVLDGYQDQESVFILAAPETANGALYSYSCKPVPKQASSETSQQGQPADPNGGQAQQSAATANGPGHGSSPATVTAMHLSIWNAVIGVGFLTTVASAFLPSSGAESQQQEAGNAPEQRADLHSAFETQATAEAAQSSSSTFDADLQDVVVAAVSKTPAYDWFSPGIPIQPVSCDALLVAHRFCLSIPLTRSAWEMSLAAADKISQPRQVALIEHLALCVADHPGSQHIAPVLVIPHVSCLQLPYGSAANELRSPHPETSTSPAANGNVIGQLRAAGRQGAPELQLQVECIQASLHGQQAVAVGKLMALWPPKGQQAAQQPISVEAGHNTPRASTPPPPPPLTVSAQIGAVSIAWDASPTVGRDHLVLLNWQQVQLALQSTRAGDNAEGMVGGQQQAEGHQEQPPEPALPPPEPASILASLGWQELRVSVCRHQMDPASCRTPSGAQQHTPGQSDSPAGGQGAAPEHQGPRLHTKQLAFLDTLAAQHSQSRRSRHQQGASIRPGRPAKGSSTALHSPLHHSSSVAQRSGSGVLGGTPGTLTQEALLPLARADNSIAMSRYFSAQQSLPAGRTSSSGALGGVNLDASGRLPGAMSSGALAGGRSSGTGAAQGSLPVVSEPTPWLQVQPVQAHKHKVSRHRQVDSLGGSPTAQQLQLQPTPAPGSLPQAVSKAFGDCLTAVVHTSGEYLRSLLFYLSPPAAAQNLTAVQLLPCCMYCVP
jgi:hypothetical protein